MRCTLRPFLCCIAALAVSAPSSLAQRYSFSTAGAGMDNLNVDSIAQDHAGYLWVGTENGLYRYDGGQFREFGATDGLLGRTVQNLFETSDGTLLVGTTAGIYFETKGGSFAEIHPPDPVNRFSQRIGTVFTETALGQVVAADRSGAFMLKRFETDRWEAERLHLEEGPIWSVLSVPSGALWYGCGSDLCRYQDGKTAHMGASLHLPPEQWLHLLLARDGHVWIRGASHLGEVSPSEGRYLPHMLPGTSNTEPYDALVMDGKGRVAASQGPAFGIWESGKWRMVTPGNGLTNFDISSLFVDREGSLWIGAVGHGLMRWVGQDLWEAFTTAEGLSNDIVWTSLRDKSGRLWVGTESGLNWIGPGEVRVTQWKSGSIATPRSVSLSEGADGNIWLGSAAGTLVRVDQRTMAGREWKTPQIYRTLCDSAHQLWIATGEGLYVMDTTAGDHAPQHVQDAGIEHPNTRFSDLSMGPGDQLWAASDLGLYRLDKGSWQRIDPGLSGVNPYLVAADRQGNLWAAGHFAGIMRLRFSGNRVVETEHVVRPHLLSDQVVAMFVDSRGWLWVAQDEGVTVFDGRTWRSFTHDDGLIWNDLDSNGISQDKDGSMWFGTSGGLSHLIKPETIPAITPQKPSISQIAFGATAINSGAEIPWSSTNPLTITIAPLSFRDAHSIHIRYRLLGLEPNWVETTDENVRYPRLDPGSYRFQAETVDTTGDAASEVHEVDFRITPHWWQNSALRIALVLLSVLLVAALWRWRVHLLVSQKGQLELAVQRRTDDLQREKAELLRAREQMRHYAEHDDLTGLWNHRIIIERLRGEVDRSRREGVPLSLILVDLDHFKEINDTHGHPSGDLALKEISAVFQRAVRSYDWVGRYGGEEFLLILPGSNLASARLRAEQMRVAVEVAHISNGKASIKVTASFGVASGFPADYESILHAADKALYRAKDSGRNCVVALEIDATASSVGAKR